MIQHDFHEMLYDGSLRARLQHSLVLLPLAAPLSIGRFDRLLIAASQDPSYSFIERPWGGTPTADEKIIWADLTVEHDGFIHRTKKITGSIREYMKNEKITLQVCLRPKINCCACEKCYRTITSLILAGIDPRDCGFDIDHETFDRIKSYFMSAKMSFSGTDYRWTPVQKLILKETCIDICGSKKFLKWFKDFDLRSTKKNVQLYRDLYYKMPYNIAKLLDKIYQIADINIHEASPTPI
jgi:hypothetical protein